MRRSNVVAGLERHRSRPKEVLQSGGLDEHIAVSFTSLATFYRVVRQIKDLTAGKSDSKGFVIIALGVSVEQECNR